MTPTVGASPTALAFDGANMWAPSLARSTLTVLLFASAAVASKSATYTLMPNVMASGGGVASSPNYSFVSTLGQPQTGSGSSAAYATCSGYWPETAAFVP